MELTASQLQNPEQLVSIQRVCGEELHGKYSESTNKSAAAKETAGGMVSVCGLAFQILSGDCRFRSLDCRLKAKKLRSRGYLFIA
jgi:hypothetical protein